MLDGKLRRRTIISAAPLALAGCLTTDDLLSQDGFDTSTIYIINNIKNLINLTIRVSHSRAAPENGTPTPDAIISSNSYDVDVDSNAVTSIEGAIDQADPYRIHVRNRDSDTQRSTWIRGRGEVVIVDIVTDGEIEIRTRATSD